MLFCHSKGFDKAISILHKIKDIHEKKTIYIYVK